MQTTTHRERNRLAALAAGLDAMSPMKVLARGYSLAQNGEGRILSSVDQAALGEEITLRLADGRLNCTVMNKKKDV
ncbi:MAG: hypothetical protein LUH16_06210, partial [Clostridiales bacterium]|nr:hypothetical protein [Clostridiales bacterium]